MTDEPEQSEKAANFLIVKKLLSLDGAPVNSRTSIHQIRSELMDGTLTRKHATAKLADFIVAIQAMQKNESTNPSAEVREGVEQHYQRVADHIYELADEFSLPVARMVSQRKRLESPDSRSR